MLLIDVVLVLPIFAFDHVRQRFFPLPQRGIIRLVSSRSSLKASAEDLARLLACPHSGSIKRSLCLGATFTAPI